MKLNRVGRIVIVSRETAVDLIMQEKEIYFKAGAEEQYYLTDEVGTVCEYIKRSENNADVFRFEGKYYVRLPSNRNIW